MILRDEWADRIFQRLTGIYGSQFTAKFKQIVDGIDEGTANAKGVWAKELGNFADKPEAIAYALDHLPTEHAPNALEFRDICRRAPVREVPMLMHKLSNEELDANRKRAADLIAKFAKSKAAL